jgi:hypothetical protein
MTFTAAFVAASRTASALGGRRLLVLGSSGVAAFAAGMHSASTGPAGKDAKEPKCRPVVRACHRRLRAAWPRRRIFESPH